MSEVPAALRFPFVLAVVLISAVTLPGSEVLIDVGDTWSFFRGRTAPSNPMNLWRQPGFAAGDTWEEGPTGIGYGDGDDQTVLSDMRNGYVAIFTRKKFDVADPTAISNLFLSIDYDDGFVAYLNGVEVARRNVGNPGQEFSYNQVASGGHEAGTPLVLDLTANLDLLVAGVNLLAVEIRNVTLDSSDLSFIPILTTDDRAFSCPSASAFTCGSSGGGINLSWVNNSDAYESIAITKNGEDLPGSPFSGDTVSFLDSDPGYWDALYELTAILEGEPCTKISCSSTVQSRGEGTLQCSLSLVDGSTQALLTWTNVPGTVQAEIRREGTLIATLNAGEEEYLDPDVESAEPEDDTDFQVVLRDGEGRSATMACGPNISLCPMVSCGLIPDGEVNRIRLTFGNLVKEWERFTILRSEDGGPAVTVTDILPGDSTEFVDADFLPKSGSNYQYTVQPSAPPGEQVNCDRSCTISIPLPEFGRYDPPAGGWDYSIDFEGHPETSMNLYNPARGEGGNLDGQWIRAADRDQWDGSAPDEIGPAPGGPAPGGIEIVSRPGMGPCSENIQVLRIVDPGDPSNPGGSLAGVYPNAFSDPSNKSIFLGYDTGIYERNLLRSGVTFTARWRVDPNAPGYMNASSTGDGEPLVGGALGNVGFHFLNRNGMVAGEGSTASVSFSLNSGDVLQFSAVGGPLQLSSASITTFRTLWVTVEDPEGDETYDVTVYANGQTTPFSFVTRTGIALAGDTFDFGEESGNYLTIGLPDVSNDSVIEIDFVSFREGVHPPTATPCSPVTETHFLRGDADLNDVYELTDAIIILGFLFQSAEAPPCLDAIDTDDTGELDLTDVIRLLGFLFQDIRSLPLPGSTCGPDATPDDPLDCAQSGCP